MPIMADRPIPCRSGLVVSTPDCGVRTKVRISPWTAVFIANVSVICSLGHGLRTFIAVPRSVKSRIPPGSLNRVPAGVNGGMSSLPGGR